MCVCACAQGGDSVVSSLRLELQVVVCDLGTELGYFARTMCGLNH